MGDGDAGAYEEGLLLEAIGEKLGLDRVSARITGDSGYAMEVLVGLNLVVSYGILDPYNHFVAGKSSIVSDPYSVVFGVALAFGVWGVRYMRSGYADAMTELRAHDRPDIDDHSAFTGFLSLRTKALLYAGFLAAYYGNLVFRYGVETVIQIEGVLAGVVGQFVMLPLVSFPLLLDFAVLFFGIHVLMPKRLSAVDPQLFYYDPRNMGGFGPIGVLLKRSYYVYTTGLLILFGFLYGQVLLGSVLDSPYPPPGPLFAVFFTIAWLVGVASIGYSMYRIHSLMAAKKATRIRELEADLRNVIENPYSIRDSSVTDPEELEEIKRQLTHVRATREYPTTFTMWSQIAISVLLPQALQMAFRAA